MTIDTFVLNIFMKAPILLPTEKEKTIMRLETQKSVSSLTNPTPIVNPNQDSKRKVEVNIDNVVEYILRQDGVKEGIQLEANKQIDTEDSIKKIRATLSEYLNSYLFLGYDINRNRIIVRETKNDQDEDSLIEMLRFVFFRIVNGGAQPEEDTV